MSTPVTRHLLSPMWDGLTADEQASVLEVLSVFQEQLHAWREQYHQNHADMVATAHEVIQEVLSEGAQPELPSWHEQLGYQTPHYLQFTDPQRWHYWHPQIELSAASLGDDSERKGIVIPGRWNEMVTNYRDLADELLGLAQAIKRGKVRQQQDLTRTIYSSRLSDSGKLLLGKVISEMYPAVRANHKILSEIPLYEGTRAQTISEQAAAIAEVNQLTYKQLTDLEQTIQAQIKEMSINLERQFHALTTKVQFAQQLTQAVEEQALTALSVSPRVQAEARMPDPPVAILIEEPVAQEPGADPAHLEQSSPEGQIPTSDASEQSPVATAPLSPHVETLRLQLVGNDVISNWYRK